MNYTAPPPLKVDRVTQSDLNEVSFLLIVIGGRAQADMSELRSVPSCKLSLALERLQLIGRMTFWGSSIMPIWLFPITRKMDLSISSAWSYPRYIV